MIDARKDQKCFIGRSDRRGSDEGDEASVLAAAGAEVFEYVPTVVDETHLLVTIPFADAMQLDPGRSARLQLALTDADGNPQAADIVTQPVKELLKEAGYD